MRPHRWCKPSVATHTDGAPEGLGQLRFSMVVIVVALAGWLSSNRNLHTHEPLVAALRDRPSTRTLQPWRSHLANYVDANVPQPLLVFDDGEGTRPDRLDLLRRLTARELNTEVRCSILLVGTDELLRTQQHPDLVSVRTRVSYARHLRPFSLEATRNHVHFQVQMAGWTRGLFADDAVPELFQVSLGIPRIVNQVALLAKIQAAVEGRDIFDGGFTPATIAARPLLPEGHR